MAVLAEHLTDYWCARNKRNLKKANNNGRLWEEWDKEGRQGIDHVWMQAGASERPGVVADTKSSLFGAVSFMAALPEDIKAQLRALGESDSASQTPGGQPNIFENEQRDGVDPAKVRVKPTSDNEAAMKKVLPETKTKGVQMSHLWIGLSLPQEQLTDAGRSLIRLVARYEKESALNSGAAPPYARWVVMATGRQKHLHAPSQGHQHEIQKPLVVLPDSILSK